MTVWGVTGEVIAPFWGKGLASTPAAASGRCKEPDHDQGNDRDAQPWVVAERPHEGFKKRSDGLPEDTPIVELHVRTLEASSDIKASGCTRGVAATVATILLPK